jgi:hypothetical protein
MRERATFVLIGAIFVGALLVGIGGPFLRHREVCGTYFSVLARNQVRLGYGATRLGSYEVSSPDLGAYPDWRIYAYANRPFVSTFVTSLWFRVFGDREWVLRLSLIAASLGTLAAFVLLARRILDPPWVVPATALFAFNPMFWYFSVVAVHLVYALLFSLAAWACWVRAEESRRCRAGVFVFLFLACQSDWPGYYAALSLSIDALALKRRGQAAAILGFAVGCFGLHLLHLVWIDPEHGPLVRRFLAAGAERTIQSLPGPVAFVRGELRELALYFTVGLLGLAAVGVRGLPRRIWLLALLGLDEIVFLRWAALHDYLTFPLAPFVALAAVRGLGSLAATPKARLAAGAALLLAAAQSLWVMGDRLTRKGAYEVQYRAGMAIREGTRPDDRVLLTIDDIRQYTPYYADRFSAGIEQGSDELMVHPSGRRFPASGVGDLERYFGEYSVVLVGDPGRAAGEIGFFRGKPPPPEFRFLDDAHPLRKALEARALSKEIRGAFVLYRLR